MRIIAFAVLVVAFSIAQDRTKNKFEVAVVKRAAADEQQGSEINISPGGRIRMTNLTLKSMIMYAWHLRSFQVLGAKGWIDSDLYSIEAKPEQSPQSAELEEMLKALLIDRFSLTTHSESVEQTVYVLVKSIGERKAPNLIEVKGEECLEPSLAPPVQATTKAQIVQCGEFVRGRSWMKGAGIPIGKLIDGLSAALGQIVSDETGLKGNFNLVLEWNPLSNLATLSNSVPGTLGEDTGPSLVSAIQDQLALKLQSKKGPVPVLVLDKAVRPD